MGNRRGQPILILLVTLLGLLIFTSLLVGTDTLRHRGPWRVFSKDTAHLLGVVGAVLLGTSALYSALRRRFPRGLKTWLNIHCILGILSLLTVGVHIINRVEAARPSHFLSFFTFGLMVIIVSSGVGGRYARKIKIVRDHWRSLHISLTAIFYITLAVHVLVKMGALQ
jgi:hypothetical protein